MKLLRRSATCGALNKRFERDRAFQHGDIIAGPGATPAGNDNADLSLRYGTFKPKREPKAFRAFGVKVLVGRNAAEWADLSVIDGSFLVVTPRLAVGW